MISRCSGARAHHRSPLAAIAAGIMLLLPEVAAACSRVPTPLPPAPGTVHFTGIALADTVLAGAGAVRYRVAPGHFGRGADRAIHGQRVRVARLGRSAPAEVRRAVGQQGEIVLVPWDYGPDCHPVPWSRSARWLESGTTGAFVAKLRDRAQWVDGRPTLDVHMPEFLPYPSAPALRAAMARRAPEREASLSADELIDLYDQLTPVIDATSSSAPDTLVLKQAAATLLAWEREHPALARRDPATALVGQALYEANARLVRVRTHDEEGTYRVRVALRSGVATEFYFRTVRGEASPVYPSSLGVSVTVTPRPVGDAPLVIGTLHRVVLARQAEELPTTVPSPLSGDSFATAGFGVVTVPLTRDSESRIHRAQLYLGSAGRFVAADSVLTAAYGEKPWILGDAEVRDFYAARLERHAGGRITLTHTITRDGIPVGTATAERSSATTARLTVPWTTDGGRR